MNQQQRAELEAKIQTLETVSTAPAILAPLLQMLRLPADQLPIEKVVHLISRDAAVAAQCVHVANSPLFARRQVETARGAVMTLGIERVRSVLIALCMNQTVPASNWVLNRSSFWRHSLGCALVTQTMAQVIGYPEPEKAYLAGLIHDIGFLVNSRLYNEKLKKCLEFAVDHKCALHVAEESILGFSHQDSGGILCRRWGFSEQLQEVAAHHHLDGVETTSPLVCLVHLSDLLCRVRNLSYGYYEVLAVTLAQNSAWKPLISAYPSLAEVDFVRFVLDMDGRMPQISALVDSVFAPARTMANSRS
jgi:putative nucleotidyltransferase with HDIG domain